MADSPTPILEIENLRLSFNGLRPVEILHGVNLTVGPREVLGIIGESGSGKSVTAMSVLRLIPDALATITGGAIRYRGENLIERRDLVTDVRGKKISMVFQSPGNSLHPLYTVEKQIGELLKLHRRLVGADAGREIDALLEQVGLSKSVRKHYPHELSGGMQQRVSIAMAICCHPDLLIADEPTSALDVTIQKQVLDLLSSLKADGLVQAIMLITHDFGVVASLCDSVAVMNQGSVVESGPVSKVMYDPHHEYTSRLLSSMPRIGL